MEKEYASVERENAKLKEIAIKAKGTSSKLEKIVYGPYQNNKPNESKVASTSALLKKKVKRRVN